MILCICPSIPTRLVCLKAELKAVTQWSKTTMKQHNPLNPSKCVIFCIRTANPIEFNFLIEISNGNE